MPIETPEEFREWLEEQPHETCLLIAVRAALRVFPIAIHTHKVGAENERVALLIARALLTAGVASVLNSRAISLASTAAENAADQGADASHEAGMATISAVTAASSSSSSRTALTKSAVEYSAEAVESVLRVGDSFIRTKAAEEARSAAYLDAENPFPSLLEVPIWHGPEEPDWLGLHLASTTRLLESGLNWSFWLEWYQGFLDGNPLDWELQRRVALIDDAIWEAGPEAVAAEIERIRAEWLAEKLPQAEEIIRDPDDGLFKVSSVAVDPDDMINRMFDQLNFSLDLALRGHNASGFNEMCTAFSYLEHTSKNCRDDPNAVHMHLRLAREIIEGKLRSGEYQSEDALSALVTAMERHEIQLRADHPVIREAHKTFVAQKLRELGDEKLLEIAQGFRSLQPDSKERLKDEYGLDAETLETDTGPEAQADALKRSGGRTQKMSVAERTSSAIKAADGSAVNKATGMMFKVQKLAELLTGLF